MEAGERNRKVKVIILQDSKLYNTLLACRFVIKWIFADRNEVDLHALEYIEEVVHSRQMLNILKYGDQQSWGDGDGSSQQHPGKTGPAQVQETLL